MTQAIVGLAALTANQYGSLEVGNNGNGGNGGGPLRVIDAKGLPRSFVGFPTTSIPAPGSDEIQVDVQREMRPDRLIIGPLEDIIGVNARRIRDIRVGTVSLNASPNPVPAEVFARDSVGTSIRATMTATPAIGIQVFAEQTAGPEVPWVVEGTFIGPSAKPGESLQAIVGQDEEGLDPGAGSEAKSLPQSFVGIPYTAPAAVGVRQVIQIPIQRDIRPDRMILPENVCSEFVVRDLRVGTVSLNASMNPAAGDAFHRTAFGSRLRATVTATPSVGIQLEITRVRAVLLNTSVCGAIFGPSRYASS
jgi:hypothetical protein